ncbi:hypothetical protein QF205_11010 [Luteimonas composti]|uniref:Tip attachment protein J domain-containing protein n=1 Tax=Luteimonas composti TaxID=398257 RepID=A0ABT6MSF9_9GAMM|nr:hypothetical protein [Luteimonas composti]MDH7453592.1 hypothetical protein [Luteimonas composti]
MGGKDDKPVIGYHYRVAYHAGLGRGPIDAFLEFRAADKTAWDGSAQTWFLGGEAIRKRGSGYPINEETLPATGPLTASGSIYIGKPNLFGGSKDQGGIEGPMNIMFGEADQMPNPYLQEVFGDQTVAWRGLATVAFCGGRYGAMNPMPQKPAYKVRKILKGWDGDWGEDPCWYPERAEIRMGRVAAAGRDWRYLVTVLSDATDRSAADYDDSAWATGRPPFANASWFLPEQYGFSGEPATVVPAARKVWMRARLNFPELPPEIRFQAFLDNDAILYVNGQHVVTVGANHGAYYDVPISTAAFVVGENSIAVVGWDRHTGGPPDNWFWFDWRLDDEGDLIAMNPAHALYYVRTDGEKGREPYANINDDSLRAAADRLYAEGFGICWQYDPKQDTPDSWSEHICRIIGGSFTRSLVDGQWYLDLARGDYDIDSLPIIGDDDILEFRELPTTLDRAVNSVSVRYFDPERKEKIITPAVRALGLIRMFGEIHQTLDFPEIPDGRTATRVADRELRAYVTPKRTFELMTTPRTRAIRNNQYFRLQSPRRGIADMVCIMGEQDAGTLRSGALRRKVTQDVYGLPDASYIEVEPGVDTRPPETPLAVALGQVFEAPYVVLAGSVPRAELAAIPDDVGYLLTVAADPGQHLDYRVAVASADGAYHAGGTARWCPTALIVEAADHAATEFTFVSGRHLALAVVGSPVLWGSEICRLDDLDVVSGTITLARGCADTVAHVHAAGERIWIVVEVARGPGEFSDGEEVLAKLLTRTPTAELPLSSAPALPLEFAGRQARPYPPANVRLNGEAAPLGINGDVVITAVHRDRVLQADQLVDQSVGDIGPEPGTTYTVRNVDRATNVQTYVQTGITEWPHVVPSSSLASTNRLEVFSVRDGLESWQRVVREFDSGTILLAEDGEPIRTEDGEPIVME